MDNKESFKNLQKLFKIKYLEKQEVKMMFTQTFFPELLKRK